MAGGQWLSGPLLPAEYGGYYYRRTSEDEDGLLVVIGGSVGDGSDGRWNSENQSVSGAGSYRLTSIMCDADDIDAGLWECETERYVMLIGAPLLLLLGTVGNALTFAVMATSGIRFGPTACYLQALAASDTLTLWIGLGRHFYKRVTWVDIRNVSPAACQLQRFLLYTSMDCSAWFLVGLTVDRFIAVCLPMHKGSFTAARARAAICITAACCCLFNMHVFWTRGAELVTTASRPWSHVVTTAAAAVERPTSAPLEESRVGGAAAAEAAASYSSPDAEASAIVRVDNCGYPNEFSREFWTYTQGWLAMLKYSIIPSLLMLAFNAAIMRTLHKQDKRMSAHSLAASERKPSAGNSDGHNPPENRRQVCRPHNRPSEAESAGGKQPPVRSAPRLTAMLLACTMFFLCVGAPAYVYNSCEVVIYRTVNDPRRKGTLELIDAAVTLLNYLNHAANFFLYATVGVGFRHEVRKLLCRNRRWYPFSRSSSGAAADRQKRASSLKHKSALPLLL